jgi:hypothetical protein
MADGNRAGRDLAGRTSAGRSGRRKAMARRRRTGACSAPRTDIWRMEETHGGVIGEAPAIGRRTGASCKLDFPDVRPAVRGMPEAHFRGRPRFAKTTPCESASQRSRLASLSASLRSGPGGNKRACSNASAARISQSIRSDPCCVSLFMMACCDYQTEGKLSKTTGVL